jgi:hypothetical protein
MKRIHFYNQWRELKDPYFDIELFSIKFSGFDLPTKGRLDLDITILGFNIEIQLIK